MKCWKIFIHCEVGMKLNSIPIATKTNESNKNQTAGNSWSFWGTINWEWKEWLEIKHHAGWEWERLLCPIFVHKRHWMRFVWSSRANVRVRLNLVRPLCGVMCFNGYIWERPLWSGSVGVFRDLWAGFPCLDASAWGQALAAAASQVGRVCYSVGWVAGGGTVLEQELIRRVW